MASSDTTSHLSDQAVGDQPEGFLIVVGVSAATGSEAAVQWAAEEARRRQGRVRAVMAWRSAGLPGGAPGRPPAQAIIEYDQAEFAEEKLNDFVVAALGEDHGVECRAVEGGAASVLLKEAESAALLVLDSPRMSKLTNPRARRLASRIIYRADCPVLVMPPPVRAPSPEAQDTAEELDQSDVDAG